MLENLKNRVIPQLRTSSWSELLDGVLSIDEGANVKYVQTFGEAPLFNLTQGDTQHGTITCTHISGNKYTLTATADSGYTFASWSTGQRTSSITLSLSRDIVVYALFKKANTGSFTVSATSTYGTTTVTPSTVTAGNACRVSFIEGASDPKVFHNWIGLPKPIKAKSFMFYPTTDTSLSVGFCAPPLYHLTAQANPSSAATFRVSDADHYITISTQSSDSDNCYIEIDGTRLTHCVTEMDSWNDETSSIDREYRGDVPFYISSGGFFIIDADTLSPIQLMLFNTNRGIVACDAWATLLESVCDYLIANDHPHLICIYLKGGRGTISTGLRTFFQSLGGLIEGEYTLANNAHYLIGNYGENHLNYAFEEIRQASDRTQKRCSFPVRSGFGVIQDVLVPNRFSLGLSAYMNTIPTWFAINSRRNPLVNSWGIYTYNESTHSVDIAYGAGRVPRGHCVYNYIIDAVTGTIFEVGIWDSASDEAVNAFFNLIQGKLDYSRRYRSSKLLYVYQGCQASFTSSARTFFASLGGLSEGTYGQGDRYHYLVANYGDNVLSLGKAWEYISGISPDSASYDFPIAMGFGVLPNDGVVQTFDATITPTTLNFKIGDTSLNTWSGDVYTLTYDTGTSSVIATHSTSTLSHNSVNLAIISPTTKLPIVCYTYANTSEPNINEYWTYIASALNTLVTTHKNLILCYYTQGTNQLTAAQRTKLIDWGCNPPAAYASANNNYLAIFNLGTNVLGTNLAWERFTEDVVEDESWLSVPIYTGYGVLANKLPSTSNTKAITLTEPIDYEFVSWDDEGATTASRIVTLTNDLSVSALFSRVNTYTLSIPTVEHVTVSTVRNSRNNYTLTATPAPEYEFTSWSNGSTSNPLTIELTENTTIAPIVEYHLYQLSINTTYSNTEVTVRRISGNTFNLSANIIEGARFNQWSDGDTTNPRTITISSDTTLSAYVDLLSTVLITSNSEYVTCDQSMIRGYLGEGRGLVYDVHPAYNFGGIYQDGYLVETHQRYFVNFGPDGTTITLEGRVGTPKTFTISFSGSHCSFSPNQISGVWGSVHSVTCTPDSGYRFISWSDGNTNPTRSFTIGVENQSFSVVTKKIVTYTFNGVHSILSPSSCTDVVGTIVDVTATPEPHYQFSAWHDGNTSNPRAFTLGQNDTTYTATSTAITYTTLFTSVHGNIREYPSGTGSASITKQGVFGASYSIQAYDPDTNYTFSHWTKNGATFSSDDIINVTQGDTTDRYEAVYVLASYTYTFEAEHGSCSPESFTGNTGNQVTVFVVADSGYVFKQWDDGNTSNPRTFTIGSSNEVFTATFDRIYTIGLRADNGTVSPTSIAGVVGTFGTAIVTPNSGYIFDSWSDGVRTNPRTFTVGSGNQNLIAYCEPQSSTCNLLVHTDMSYWDSLSYPRSVNRGASATITGVINIDAEVTITKDSGIAETRTLSAGDTLTYTTTINNNCVVEIEIEPR